MMSTISIWTCRDSEVEVTRLDLSLRFASTSFQSKSQDDGAAVGARVGLFSDFASTTKERYVLLWSTLNQSPEEVATKVLWDSRPGDSAWHTKKKRKGNHHIGNKGQRRTYMFNVDYAQISFSSSTVERGEMIASHLAPGLSPGCWFDSSLKVTTRSRNDTLFPNMDNRDVPLD